MRRAAALAALLLLAAPAAAQEDHRALADRAVKAGYEQAMSQSIMDAFWPVALELIRQRVAGLTEIQLFQYKGKTEGFAAEAAHGALAPLVDLFERGFTDDELQAVIAFYESPAGIKLSGARPLISEVMSGLAADGLKTEIGRFEERIDAMLKADGY